MTNVGRENPLAKVIAPTAASPFVCQIVANTDVIGGGTFDTKYAQELLTIDPIAELVDDCLVVSTWAGGQPFLHRWFRLGKDSSGRFVREGDAEEAFMLYPPGVTYTKADIGKHVYICGRVVGFPREFPRSYPTSYRVVSATAAA